MPPAEILISAGEASGDMYAARLAAALRARADVRLFGMGGPRMREAGVDTVVDCAEVGVVGVFEVFRKLPALLRARQRLLDEVARRRPAFAILTDFPGFHLRLARMLRRRGVRNIYFVCPQFWAWRPWRANLVRRRFVRGLCIFPFEVDFYRKAGVPVDWIGHPLVDQVHPSVSRAEFISRHGLDPARPIIAVLPGSRPGELAQHMPLLREAAAQIQAGAQSNASTGGAQSPQFVLAAAPGLTRAQLAAFLPEPSSHLADPGVASAERKSVSAGPSQGAASEKMEAGRQAGGRGFSRDPYAGASGALAPEDANDTKEAMSYHQGVGGDDESAVSSLAAVHEAAGAAPSKNVSFHIVEDETYDALAAADLAIVSSGTATVETALIGTPMIVVYRVSPASAWVARRLVRTPYFAMVNLIAGKRVVPELFQEDCSPQRVAAEAARLLTSSEAREQMRLDLAVVRERLGPPGAIDRAAAIIAAMLQNP